MSVVVVDKEELFVVDKDTLKLRNLFSGLSVAFHELAEGSDVSVALIIEAVVVLHFSRNAPLFLTNR